MDIIIEFIKQNWTDIIGYVLTPIVTYILTRKRYEVQDKNTEASTENINVETARKVIESQGLVITSWKDLANYKDNQIVEQNKLIAIQDVKIDSQDKTILLQNKTIEDLTVRIDKLEENDEERIQLKHELTRSNNAREKMEKRVDDLEKFSRELTILVTKLVDKIVKDYPNDVDIGDITQLLSRYQHLLEDTK